MKISKLWFTLIIAVSYGFISALGFGLIGPIFSLRMDDYGLLNTQIGGLISIVGFAPLLFTPFIPRLLRIIPIKEFLAASIVLILVCYYLFTITNGPYIWTIIRFFFSVIVTLMFVASESWILELAPEKYRGRVLGLYATLFSFGAGIGGILIAKFGHASNQSIYIIMVLTALPLLYYFAPTLSITKPNKESSGFFKVFLNWKITPLLFLPAFVIGAIETAAFNLLPVWVRRIELNVSIEGLIITACAFGNLLLQTPIGALSDKIGRNKTLFIIGIIAVTFPFLMTIKMPDYLLLILAGIWSGATTGYYTLGLLGFAELNNKDEIASNNATFGTTYCVGQLIAPLTAGAFMEWQGPNGLMYCLAFLGLLPILALFYRQKTVGIP